ncbi:MAG: hypothetical protein JWO13_2297 [Acidobacteriales bacterium]|nr:hypothetical protein [Terriglobales bacterium]
MKSMVRVIFACLSLLCAIQAQDKPQLDLSVFGFQIGKPFNLAECPTMQVARERYTYSGSSGAPCYKRTGLLRTKVAPVYTATVLIQFPSAEQPALSSGLDISAQVMDGNLEGIGFNTAGVRDGEKVLQSLIEKYGEPTTKQLSTVQGSYGTVYPMIVARWAFSNLEVSFKSISTELSSGLVTIDSIKCREWRQATLKRLTGSGRTL